VAADRTWVLPLRKICGFESDAVLARMQDGRKLLWFPVSNQGTGRGQAEGGSMTRLSHVEPDADGGGSSGGDDSSER
jgi:uncharacterized membrane protein YgcG